MFELNKNCNFDIIPNTDTFQQPLSFIDSSNCKFITFNPNNPTEFLYYSKFSKALLIFNRATLKKSIFKSMDNINYPPRWSVTHQIVFQNSDGNITLFNENGAIIKLIGKGLVADFNLFGDKLIYQAFIPSIGQYRGVIYNIYTNKYDTLRNILNVSNTWHNNERLICYFTYEEGKTGINIYNVENNKNSLIQRLNTDIGAPYSFQWINENEYFYNQHGMLYVFNIKTAELKLIGEVCSGENIGWSSYCSKSKELITNISHWTSIDKNTVKITSKVLILNFGTGNHSYINL